MLIEIALQGSASPSLRFDEQGFWLARNKSVIKVESVEYRYGRFKDELRVNGETFAIPTGKASKVRELLRRWRLGEAAEFPKTPLLEKLPTSLGAWLKPQFIGGGEMLIAALGSARTQELQSALGPSCEADVFFLLTTHRSMLVASTEFGDVWEQQLEGPITVKAARGRDEVRCGEHQWRTTLTNEGRYHLIAPWTALNPSERRRAAIRHSLDQGDTDNAGRLVGPLEAEAKLQDPRLALGAWASSASLEGSASSEHTASSERPKTPTSQLLQGFDRALAPGEALAWADHWKLDDEARLRVLELLRHHHAESAHALALHRDLHARTRSDDPLAIDADLRWADHLAAAGHPDQAFSLLRGNLEALGNSDITDLIAHGGEDEANPAIRARVSLLEAMQTIAEQCLPEFELEIRRALARLEPLQQRRLGALLPVAPPELHRRTKAAIAAVQDPFRPLETKPKERAPLTEEQLNVLQHPVGRTDEVMGFLSTYVAAVETPDHSALKAYCQRLGTFRNAQAQSARLVFEHVASSLGVEAQVFVSQGDANIGCRGYEGENTHFVVLGGAHLDPNSERFLSPAELAFAFGTELAHLRFGHARVTSNELWRGAVNLGFSGFDLAVSSIPLLGRYRIGDGLSLLANAFRDGTAQKALEQAKETLWGKGEAPSAPNDEKTPRREELIAAHRLMQLTGDRAGLLHCQNPSAAIRALFALDPGEVFEDCKTLGLYGFATAVNEEKSTLRYEGLALRISALLSFWLSEDYATLTNP